MKGRSPGSLAGFPPHLRRAIYRPILGAAGAVADEITTAVRGTENRWGV
jgi:hypothetical protein